MKVDKKNVDVKSLRSVQEISAKPSTKCRIFMIGGVLFAFIAAATIITALLLTRNQNTNTSTTNGSTSSSSTAVTFQSCWSGTGVTVAGVANVTGTAANLLDHPLSAKMDSSNVIYVVDGWNHRVQRWLPNALSGSTVAGRPSGAPGTNLSSLNYPSDVALDSSSNIYVVDAGNSRVVFWAVGAFAGVLVAGAGGYGSATNQLAGPLGLARDSTTGTLYIADTLNHRVMSYASGASTGTVVAGGNGQGSSSTQLSNPRGIQYVSSSNSVYIANNNGHNVVRWVIGASSWTLIAGSPSGVGGSTGILLSFPTYVLVDPFGNVYVSDEGNQRIQYFLAGQTNGSTLAGVNGVSGITATLLNTPSSVAIDSQYNIYAVDYGNQRVQKFVQC